MTALPKVEVSWRRAIEFCNDVSLREGFDPGYAIEIAEPVPSRSAMWAPRSAPAPDDWRVSWDRTANGYRLPTDAEWQRACRAGTGGRGLSSVAPRAESSAVPPAKSSPPPEPAPDIVGWDLDSSVGAKRRILSVVSPRVAVGEVDLTDPAACLSEFQRRTPSTATRTGV